MTDHRATNASDAAASGSASPAERRAADHDAQRSRPDPDPISELATIDDSGDGNVVHSPKLAIQPGPKPGFGPDESSRPLLEGNPELGIDPRDAEASPAKGRETSDKS